MTAPTFTRADLEQMAAATASLNPVPEPDRKAYALAARALLTALAEGRPATMQALAVASGREPGEIAARLREVPDVEWNAKGSVTGLGITLNTTLHRVETGGRTLYAWCAADALGVLPALGRTVRVSSPCPATGQTVTVTVGPGGVRDVHPAGAVVSAIITGDPDNIRATVCNLGNFFTSADSASGWAAEHPDGELLSVPDAFQYARSIMRLILGET